MKIARWLFLLLGSAWASDRSEFFIRTTRALQTENKTLNCRAAISPAICLTNSSLADDPLTRTCLPGGEVYASIFEKLYDQFPPSMQQMFCSVKRIFVEKDFLGSAYAGLIRGPTGRSVGAMVGIRQSLLEQKMSLSFWATWKEQLPFGGDPSHYETTPGLPVVASNQSRGEVNDFLYFVVAHEFAHIFDFANGLNKVRNCEGAGRENPDPECDVVPGSYGSLSWRTTHLPLLENHFYRWEELCFYNCQETIGPQDALDIYEHFWHTNFVSLYSSREPWNDLADTMAYHLLFEKLGASYKIVLGKDFWDIRHKYYSPIMREKREYFTMLLKRTNLIYP